MKTILLATGAFLIASAAPAFAQDTPAPAPAASAAPAASDNGAPVSAVSSSFTGPRVEIFGGWDRVGTRTRFDDGVTRDTNRTHRNGVTGGVLGGYDLPIGDKLVAGAFGSYALSTAKDCVGGVGCVKSGRQIEGGARLGLKALDGKALVYAKGAYVNGQIRADLFDGTDLIKGHANRDGWRAGAGVEYAVSSHAYVKAEYDYTRFKSFDADDLGVTDTSLRYDRNQLLGGFGVRF